MNRQLFARSHLRDYFGLSNLIPISIENNNEKIIISTTRPETIPADVAIAVHSEDPRYQFLFEENVYILKKYLKFITKRFLKDYR